MQSTFLITQKQYTPKDVGLMFFAFGISQFTFQMPAGYLIDYLEHKRFVLGFAATVTTLLTLATAVFAADDGGNLRLMLIIKFIQGAMTSFIPPCLNSITQGIVGAVGMTEQVAKNEMMHHWGTAVLVMAASLLGYILYPHLESLFLVSPIACIGVIYHLRKIKPRYIDHIAARGLIDSPNLSIKTTTSEISQDAYRIRFQPSFYCGCKSYSSDWGDFVSPKHSIPKADTPLDIMKNKKFLNFLIICFTFNLANGTILPLVMQTLAIGNGGAGILMSGCCIAVAQVFMEFSAEFCGQFSEVYGRKAIFITGICTLCLRCVVLAVLLTLKEDNELPWLTLNLIILSTQIFDGIGAGIFNTMYILVTSDLSIGTGRFSWMLGLTTAAVSLGATVSGYLGQALAEDRGYLYAFICLSFISLIPVLLYALGVPETFLDDDEVSNTARSLDSQIQQEHRKSMKSSSSPILAHRKGSSSSPILGLRKSSMESPPRNHESRKSLNSSSSSPPPPPRHERKNTTSEMEIGKASTVVQGMDYIKEVELLFQETRAKANKKSLNAKNVSTITEE